MVIMKKLKVYVAGKVSKESVFGTEFWRDDFCKELSEKTGFEIMNLDPTKSHENFDLDENNSNFIFGRDCFMVKSADLVIVNLTDDISVGGSQEMLIAKYFKKPLLAIASKEGKFVKSEKRIYGKVYKDWVHPFVDVICDKIVHNIDEASEWIVEFFIKKGKGKVKDISLIEENMKYYLDNFFDKEEYLKKIFN